MRFIVEEIHEANQQHCKAIDRGFCVTYFAIHSCESWSINQSINQSNLKSVRDLAQIHQTMYMSRPPRKRQRIHSTLTGSSVAPQASQQHLLDTPQPQLDQQAGGCVESLVVVRMYTVVVCTTAPYPASRLGLKGYKCVA